MRTLLRYLFGPLVDDYRRRLQDIEDRQRAVETCVEDYLDRIEQRHRRFLKRDRDNERQATRTVEPIDPRIAALRARRGRPVSNGNPS